MEGRAVGHTFERDHPCQVWFNLFQRFQRKRFKCDLLSKYAKRYKLAERKISQKNREYMLNYSFPCSCSTIPARFGLRWYHTHSSFSLCGFDHRDAWNLHTNIIWWKRSTDFKELSPCSVWYHLKQHKPEILYQVCI